jgi:heme oxygenase
MHEARAALRQGTAADHARLDALFGGFQLNDANDYRAFLTAHAMALTAIENALDATGFADVLGDWPQRKRGDAIAADLAELGEAVPPPLPAPPLATPAARWGAAYVIEGSRLGGALLARSVPEGLPKSYLGTPQTPGAWRTFLQKLDEALPLTQDIVLATESARATFAVFDKAGHRVRVVPD